MAKPGKRLVKARSWSQEETRTWSIIMKPLRGQLRYREVTNGFGKKEIIGSHYIVILGQALWLTPLIPTLWEAKQENHLRPGV